MIYLDNAATTPLDPEVLQLLTTCLQTFYGNPSSSHEAGTDAADLLSVARNSIAECLSINSEEVIFTASATEAINIVVHSLAEEKRHFIFSPAEHPAVLHSINLFVPKEKQHILDLKSDGLPDMDQIHEWLKSYPKAALALMEAHNETGLINDIRGIGKQIQEREGVLLCDTTQSIVKLRQDLKELNAYAVASAHKFHGPKGIGMLFLPESLSLKPLMGGGEQERGLRPGTENVAFAIAMAKAMEVYNKDREMVSINIDNWRNIIIKHLKEWFPDAAIIGEGHRDVLPHILSIAFPSTSVYQSIPPWLEECGIAVSMGSACHSGQNKISPLMLAMGLTNHFMLRISFGRFNTDADVNELMNALLDFYNDNLRKV